jgi:hypothetical protein
MNPLCDIRLAFSTNSKKLLGSMITLMHLKSTSHVSLQMSGDFLGPKTGFLPE